LAGLTPGVNFTNVLEPAFTRTDLKSTKRRPSDQCLFELLGSASARKMLMKLTPVADPIKLFFFPNKEFLRFFAAKLGHFIIISFCSMYQNTQS